VDAATTSEDPFNLAISPLQNPRSGAYPILRMDGSAVHPGNTGLIGTES
jgi:hypothetical protein